MISAVTAYQGSNLTALTTRRAELLVARDKTTKAEVKTAIAAAWKTYKTSTTDLKSVLHTARDAAWATYKTEVKACK